MVFWYYSASSRQARKEAKEEKKRLKEERKKRDIEQPNARFPATQVVYEDTDFAKPPPLNYTLRTRKKALIIFWFLVFVDCICTPIILYFALWYATGLSHNAVFSISTAALGSVSIFEYFIRFYRLYKKDSNCRVIGAKRYYLDFFQWELSIAWIGVMVELIVGTVPEEPPIRLLAMPVASMCYAIGIQMLTIDICRYLGIKAPVRISSLPRGLPLRPAVYNLIEDVCAVDGSGGTEFRQRLNMRYQASHYFRRMLHRLTLFWGFGACAIAAATTAIIFTVSKDAAYVVGWTVPFAWAAVWALATWWYVNRSLKKEYATWTEERNRAMKDG